MKIKLGTILLAAIAAAVAAGSCSPALAQRVDQTAAAQSVAGSWEGKQEGVTSVVLRIGANGGAVQGQADFFILKKSGAEAPIQAGKATAAIVDPRFQGDALEFDVVRASDKGVLHFTLQPTGERTAKLVRAGGGERLEMEMTRVE